MQNFRFSLESLLHLQKQERDACLTELSRINNRVVELERHIEILLEERKQLRSYLGTQSSRPIIDVGLLSRCHMHHGHLEVEQAQAARKLVEAQRELENQRRETVKAEQKVKALERLKEKQWEEYRVRWEMQSRREQEDHLAARLQRDHES